MRIQLCAKAIRFEDLADAFMQKCILAVHDFPGNRTHNHGLFDSQVELQEQKKA